MDSYRIIICLFMCRSIFLNKVLAILLCSQHELIKKFDARFFFQRGNPLLKFITGVAWEYDDILPDYEIGKTIGILFLSVRYYNTNPDYINNRLKELGKKYELRVLLVQVN